MLARSVTADVGIQASAPDSVEETTWSEEKKAARRAGEVIAGGMKNDSAVFCDGFLAKLMSRRYATESNNAVACSSLATMLPPSPISPSLLKFPAAFRKYFFVFPQHNDWLSGCF